MATTTTYRNLRYRTITKVTFISILSLILSHLMLFSLVGQLLGIGIVSILIYHSTLGKNDLFTFIMVMYFCSSFPFMPEEGGAFNFVSVICVGLYSYSNKGFPTERRVKDIWFGWFVSVFILSSVLGWIFNFQASIKTSIYSFFSFLGIIFLLISASRLVITTERIKVFLQLNFILIIFSTIASLNVYFSFLPFKTPIMPIYGGINYGYFESGGIIGSSPFYGEHSMILSILFSIFLILGSKDIISRKLLVLGVIISFINIFMSISRSVFLLSLLGLILILLIQVKYSKIRITNQILKVVTFVILGYGLYIFVVNSRLGYVFQRIQEIEEKNATEGGISMDRIIDGSAFNRKVAFDLNYDRYRSRDSWIIGNGYGTVSLNREAYFVDPSIKRSSAHSQIFAILFVFGWIGFIAYWGLILRIIITSIRIIQHRTIGYFHKILAGFFTIAFFLFILNEVKADSLCWPTYFSVTIIWLGLAYANSNYNIPQNVHNQNFSNIKGL